MSADIQRFCEEIKLSVGAELAPYLLAYLYLNTVRRFGSLAPVSPAPHATLYLLSKESNASCLSQAFDGQRGVPAGSSLAFGTCGDVLPMDSPSASPCPEGDVHDDLR